MIYRINTVRLKPFQEEKFYNNHQRKPSNKEQMFDPAPIIGAVSESSLRHGMDEKGFDFGQIEMERDLDIPVTFHCEPKHSKRIGYKKEEGEQKNQSCECCQNQNCAQAHPNFVSHL